MEKNLEHKIALLVDGPNMLAADLEKIKTTAQKHGSIVLMEAHLTKRASEGYIEYVIINGYQPVINSSGDIDTSLASRATEIICSPRYNQIDLIALAAMDSDYVPVIYKARDYNKKTLAICLNGNGISTALRNSVDYFETVKEKPDFY